MSAARNEGARPDLRICFFGDSFVAGVGDSSGLGWVGRVTAAARERGHRITSYNLGVRRETSVQIAARIATEAPPRLADAEDARLVVSFGVNDATERDGVERAAVDDGIRAVRTATEFIGADRLLVVGPPATADQAQNERIRARDRAMRTHADRLGVRFVSTFPATSRDTTWQHQVVVGDGYHPDAEGYRLLASVIQPVFLDWLH
ncbi:GDSL-type esterase/lipase family protein [Microbacterium sp. NPDC056234]|uniref:GDSL-type esterase/lipase family protein n=1 Tax=Microbacterium sp. NPDC056234 TaxID=3345757 RepID=UPI0035E0AD02